MQIDRGKRINRRPAASQFCKAGPAPPRLLIELRQKQRRSEEERKRQRALSWMGVQGWPPAASGNYGGRLVVLIGPRGLVSEVGPASHRGLELAALDNLIEFLVRLLVLPHVTAGARAASATIPVEHTGWHRHGKTESCSLDYLRAVMYDEMEAPAISARWSGSPSSCLRVYLGKGRQRCTAPSCSCMRDPTCLLTLRAATTPTAP